MWICLAQQLLITRKCLFQRRGRQDGVGVQRARVRQTMPEDFAPVRVRRNRVPLIAQQLDRDPAGGVHACFAAAFDDQHAFIEQRVALRPR